MTYFGVMSLEAASDLDVELINGHDVGQLRHLLQGLVLIKTRLLQCASRFSEGAKL